LLNEAFKVQKIHSTYLSVDVGSQILAFGVRDNLFILIHRLMKEFSTLIIIKKFLNSVIKILKDPITALKVIF